MLGYAGVVLGLLWQPCNMAFSERYREVKVSIPESALSHILILIFWYWLIVICYSVLLFSLHCSFFRVVCLYQYNNKSVRFSLRGGYFILYTLHFTLSLIWFDWFNRVLKMFVFLFVFVFYVSLTWLLLYIITYTYNYSLYSLYSLYIRLSKYHDVIHFSYIIFCIFHWCFLSRIYLISLYFCFRMYVRCTGGAWFITVVYGCSIAIRWCTDGVCLIYWCTEVL